MSTNTPASKDYRTLGYVIRRTNYGEADRILNLITPLGKKTVIAKGVRKSKSKLAGSIELFALTDFNIHQGKSEFGIVTGAKMVKFFGEIMKDITKMELAGVFFKKIGQVTESSDNPEYFEILNQCLAEIDAGADLRLVEVWFSLNLRRAAGEEMNLYRDSDGQKLVEDKKYNYNGAEEVFAESSAGEFSADEIKVMRLCEKMSLAASRKIKYDDEIISKVLFLVRSVNR